MAKDIIPTKLGDWDSLAYWQSGAYQTVEERLKNEVIYNPGHGLLFSALRAVPLGSCTVAILGQDPYPRREHCTGVAFSVPSALKKLPPTLVNIFNEYEDDLHYPRPMNGNLSPWCEQGVLLWNVYPSCRMGVPGSHHWEEWELLTQEIIEKLDAKENPVVFVFLGRMAAYFSQYVSRGTVLKYSHPSPLGVNRGFKGGRMFTSINVSLVHLGQKPINWRL